MESLQLFYTYRLHGALERLPRLYTFMRNLLHDATPTNGVRPLLLDMGEACLPDVWHCSATEGRSTLLALDAMGYHAANITPMSEPNRRKVQAISSIGLVDAQHVWRYEVPPVRDEGIIISAAPAPALRLCIVLAPADRAEINQRTLFLPAVASGEIGSAHIAFNEEPTLVDYRVHTLPSNTRPDATITAAIELIEDEARRITD